MTLSSAGDWISRLACHPRTIPSPCIPWGEAGRPSRERSRRNAQRLVPLVFAAPIGTSHEGASSRAKSRASSVVARKTAATMLVMRPAPSAGGGPLLRLLARLGAGRGEPRYEVGE